MVKSKILVADDDELIRAMLTEMLLAEGFEVIGAIDGNDALKKAVEEAPDLVILDIMMPRKDGYTVLYELRKTEETKNLPVIVLTAKEGQIYEGISKSMGSLYHLQKPIRKADFIEVVKEALAEA